MALPDTDGDVVYDAGGALGFIELISKWAGGDGGENQDANDAFCRALVARSHMDKGLSYR